MRIAAFLTATAVACLLAGTSASAQVATPAATPGQPPINLDAVFGTLAPTGPGCVAGVAIKGEAGLSKAYGQADLEHPDPLTTDSVFETGSLAKQFTAAAMQLLVQDGKLTLDDDIRRYLPELPAYDAPITIRNLLNHTSGLREQWNLLALTGNGPGSQVHSQATILDLASRQKGLNFTPGAEFQYVNTNYTLAAVIIERVSGVSLQQFSDQRLFKPLGMSHTRWREDFRTVVPGRATAYAPAGDGFVANMPFTNVIGNGGLLTTVGDLLRWNAFLDEPSALPGGQALVTALQTPGRLSNGASLDYALGLGVTRERGRRMVSHDGSTAGYKTWLARYPDQGVSVAVMCNNAGVNPIALGQKVADQALRAAGYSVDEAAAPAPSRTASTTATAAADLTPYQGLFRNPVTGELVQTEVANGQLTLKQGATQGLVPMGGARFQRTDGADVRFVSTGRNPDELILSQGDRTSRFVAVQPAQVGGEALAAYVGTYYSAELDARVSVVQQGDALVMRQPFAVEWKLAPSFADGFTTRLRGTTTFVFSRGADGQVVGFGAWLNGVRDVRFVRE